MLSISKLLWLAFLITVLTACASNPSQSKSPKEQPKSVQEQLAEQNLQVGEEVKRIFDLRMDGWKYLDKKNMTVHGGEEQSYLVTFRYACQGLGLPTTVIVPLTSKMNQLTRNDRFQINNKMDTIDYCRVHILHELDQVE